MQHEDYYVVHIQYMDYVQIDLYIVVVAVVDINYDHNLIVHDVDDVGYSYSYYYCIHSMDSFVVGNLVEIVEVVIEM
jgi:hypothetical protein